MEEKREKERQEGKRKQWTLFDLHDVNWSERKRWLKIFSSRLSAFSGFGQSKRMKKKKRRMKSVEKNSLLLPLLMLMLMLLRLFCRSDVSSSLFPTTLKDL